MMCYLRTRMMIKKEGAWANIKNVMGFEFDGNPGGHAICLTEDVSTNVLAKLKSGLGNESIGKGHPF